MNGGKSLLTSKTFYGAVVMLVATLLMFFKIDIGDQAGWVEAIFGLVGFVLTIIGRVKAVKRIE
jgi:hypothetical protein